MTREIEQGTEKQSRERMGLRLLILVLTIICLIIQFFVTPIFGMPEEENNLTEKLWMSSKDDPPLNLVYLVGEEGRLQSEYSPSFSYTLHSEQELVFSNPILWAPTKTYYPPHEGSKLVRITEPENIGYRQTNNTTVTIWSATRFFPRTSSIKLIWVAADCTEGNVTLESQRYADGVRVRVLNHNTYPIQYLGMVKLSPVEVNTTYPIEYVYVIEDSPLILRGPRSLEIRGVRNTPDWFEAQLPVVMEVDEYTEATFDVQIEHLHGILVIAQGERPITPPPTALLFHWAGVVAILIGFLMFMAIVFLEKRRRPSR